MARIAVLGTFDTKGEEHCFVAGAIVGQGHQPVLIDVGGLEPPTIKPDVTREQVARAAGIDLTAIVRRKDRGEMVKAMTQAAVEYVKAATQSDEFHGIISLGGSGGTAIATAAMRALPIGFPKVMVSTMASGDVQRYVGESDIVMLPSIVDVAGLNRVSRTIFQRAAGAICGMVGVSVKSASSRPVIAASMFGNTTECVQLAQKQLEAAGYEVLVFHATGAGGRTMESLIRSGMISGVLDVTTTEWADELVGGILNAGPERLDAAVQAGIPAIIVPGCLDMVNFGEPGSIPEKYRDRSFYAHNPQVTLMRTSVEESRRLGEIIAEKLNRSKGPVTVLLPLKGLSVIGAEGEAFYSPEADQALFNALKTTLNPNIPVREIDTVINHPEFARACVEALLENIRTP